MTNQLNTIDFKAAAQSLKNSQQDVNRWLKSAREQGAAALETTPWPTRKTEAWKYTSLYPLVAENYLQPAPAANVGADALESFDMGLECYRLVFVDGEFDETLSDTVPGAVAVPFSRAERPADIVQKLNTSFRLEKHIFAQVNASLMTDGFFILVPANTRIDKPIHLLHINTRQNQPFYSQQRILVVAETGSEATLIDHRDSIGASNSIHNLVTEVHVADNARLSHITLQLEAETQIAISGTHVKLGRDSHYRHFAVSIGSKVKRNDLQTNLAQSGANAVLHGVYLCKHQQHIDNQTAIDHIAAHCNSEETYRGLIMDKGKATFNGRIHIHRDAQKTDAHLNNKNLLLSKEGEINTKPELEIYADDVKCSHGATIGQLDESSLFYFQSRGIDKQRAEAMLCFGFVNAMVTELPIPEVQEYVAGRLGTFFNDVDKLKTLWAL
ncbi:MAG: Fe-S cluster assembly protein SufD [Ketobacteraceae bacterium]|nr:Fe-S cluster assembly protein SufD [Ketobacteraceae bacterium]